ncbi:MAG: hypothetical protein DRQ35_01440 [Gammaproteobacteria bacterium]|nr:MAG: hypothetical protein DRQ35_01440 [Gammaproteobacteria bacterium]RKZ94500.1 MAG: hypothetical protein DRQ46_09840 [Gammaproteobacteria bacterium]
MEITNSLINSATLEGVSPTKVSAVMTEKINKDKPLSPTVVVEEKNSVLENTQGQENNLQDAVSQINDYVQNIQRSLQFTVDEESGRDVVTVLDTKTEEIIRQYPSEEVLAFARQLAQQKEEAISLFSSRV